MIDGQPQLAKGNAVVRSFREEPESEAVLDLTPVYTNASKVVRTGTLLAGGAYRLTDAALGLRPGVTVRWGMVTRAAPGPERTGTLTLSEAGKRLSPSARCTIPKPSGKPTRPPVRPTTGIRPIRAP